MLTLITKITQGTLVISSSVLELTMVSPLDTTHLHGRIVRWSCDTSSLSHVFGEATNSSRCIDGGASSVTPLLGGIDMELLYLSVN